MSLLTLMLVLMASVVASDRLAIALGFGAVLSASATLLGAAVSRYSPQVATAKAGITWLGRAVLFVILFPFVFGALFVVYRKKVVAEATAQQESRTQVVLRVIGLASWFTAVMSGLLLSEWSMADLAKTDTWWHLKLRGVNDLLAILGTKLGKPMKLPENHASAYIACNGFSLVTMAICFVWYTLETILRIGDVDPEVSVDDNVAAEMSTVGGLFFTAGWIGATLEYARRHRPTISLVACLSALRLFTPWCDMAWEFFAKPVIEVTEYHISDMFSSDGDVTEHMLVLETKPPGAVNKIPRLFWRSAPQQGQWAINPVAWFLSQFVTPEAQTRVGGDGYGDAELTVVLIDEFGRFDKKNAMTGVVVLAWFVVWLFASLVKFFPGDHVRWAVGMVRGWFSSPKSCVPPSSTAVTQDGVRSAQNSSSDIEEVFDDFAQAALEEIQESNAWRRHISMVQGDSADLNVRLTPRMCERPVAQPSSAANVAAAGACPVGGMKKSCGPTLREGAGRGPVVTAERGRKKLSDMFKIYEQDDLIIAVPLEPQYDAEGRKIPAFWYDSEGLGYEDDGVKMLLRGIDEEEWRQEIVGRYERLMSTGGAFAESDFLRGAKKRVKPVVLPSREFEKVDPFASAYYVQPESAMDNPVITIKMQRAMRKVTMPDGRSCYCAHITFGKVDYVVFPAHMACIKEGESLFIHGDSALDSGIVGVHVPKSDIVSLADVSASAYSADLVSGDLAGFVCSGQQFFRGWARLKMNHTTNDKVLPGTCSLMNLDSMSSGRLYPIGGGALAHTCSTKPGDCGSLIVIAKTDGAARFVGMHVGGGSKNNYAVDLRSAMVSLVSRIGGKAPTGIAVETMPVGAKAEGGRMSLKAKPAKGTPAGPMGLKPSNIRATGRWAPTLNPTAEAFEPSGKNDQPFRETSQEAKPQPGGVNQSGR